MSVAERNVPARIRVCAHVCKLHESVCVHACAYAGREHKAAAGLCSMMAEASVGGLEAWGLESSAGSLALTSGGRCCLLVEPPSWASAGTPTFDPLAFPQSGGWLDGKCPGRGCPVKAESLFVTLSGRDRVISTTFDQQGSDRQILPGLPGRGR